VNSLSGSGTASSPSFSSLHGETPFFHLTENCPTFGVFHPARTAAARAAVLMVPGLGVEQLTGYRNEVLLARELAERGIPSLRFHPRGQGDSGGDESALTLRTLRDDVRAMAAELRGRAGVSRVIAVGTRFGALALGSAIAAGEPIAALALWEPVEKPADYFRGLMRGVLFSQVVQTEGSRRTMEDMTAALERDGRVDVHGYPLYRALMDEASSELGALLGSWSGRVLLIQIDARRALAPAHAALAESLGARGGPAEVRTVRDDVAWPFLQNPAWENSEVVRWTADWIHGLD
jgi:hypothetical protein